MNKLTKRILSFVLCLCVLMSIPVMSYAAEVEKVPSIKVNNVTNSKVEIEWGKVNGVKGYEVYRKAEGEKEFSRLKRQSDVKYSDSDVKPGVLYTYKVRAYKEKNLGLTKVYGAYSADLKVATYPSAVTGFTATPFSSKGIDLTWKAAEGAQKYAVYQYDDATREYVRLGTTDKTTFRVEGLTAETKYYFRIRSYHTLNGTLTSDWTKISVITPLGDVDNFRLKTCEKKAYSIAWDKTANAEGYEIYRLDSRTGTWALFRTTKARAYNFKGVSENYNAFYKIRSYATGSNGKKIYGVFTEPVAVGTLPAKPQNQKPFGEWNKARIMVYKGTVVHAQNDANVLEYHLWTPKWTDMLQASKFSAEAWPIGFELLNNCGGDEHKGYIGIQDHGDDVWYRNIRIKLMD